jgi:hypothetical protein
MNETLINTFETISINENKCYICFEYCDTKSPCECDEYVHMNCLIKFAKKNNKDSVVCTICKKEIKKLENNNIVVHNNYYKNYCILSYYFFSIILYYFLGLFSIMCFTHYLFNYDIVLYLHYRINIIIHIASILLGYTEFKILLLILSPCVNYIKNNYVNENLLEN